ncbi:hypothetical protein ACFE04_012640 [Oxalis oulophora]
MATNPTKKESLRQEIVAMRQSLIDEGTLDGRFEEIEDFNKQNHPLFVQQTMADYFEDATRMLSRIDDLLVIKPKEYAQIDVALKEFRTSSSKVGAKKVRNAINAVRDSIRHEDIKEAKDAFKQVQVDVLNLMSKMRPYFVLLHREALLEAGLEN